MIKIGFKQRREWGVYNESITETFSRQSTSIEQLSDRITLNASSISNLSGTVEEHYSELVLADSGIQTTVASKVGADSIISTINQSAESVTIDASKINLNGYVTFTNLAAYNNLTIGSADTNGNTLTIDGSTLTGTDNHGYRGYILRPSSLDIYSFDSANNYVGSVVSLVSGSGSSRIQAIGLVADYGDEINIAQNDSNNSVVSRYRITGSNYHYVTAKNYVVTVDNSTVIDSSASGTWLGTSSRYTQLSGSSLYFSSAGGCTFAVDGNIDVRGGNGKFGMYVYSGGTLTGLMVANDANSDTSKHCYIDLGYNGNVYLSGVGLYWNGTQIH